MAMVSSSGLAHDSRSEADLADAVTHDRISNAVRKW